MRRALFDGIRARPWLWIGLALGFIAGYHLLLLGAMIVRFGHWPNFARSYDVFEAVRLIIAGTPSWSDAFSILLVEPVFDVGYLSPQWRIAEWSLMILPLQFAQVTLLGFLVATFVVLLVAAGGTQCSGAPRGWWLAATVGAGMSGLCSATLFWVVCCAAPTWVVGLAMLGMSVSIATALEPAGALLTAIGFILLAAAIAAQLRWLAIASAAPGATEELATHSACPALIQTPASYIAGSAAAGLPHCSLLPSNHVYLDCVT